MDFLEQTIARLDKDDRKEFRLYIQKHRTIGRKDIELFDLLASEKPPSSRELVEKLYRPINLNAYHSLRKRLMKQLFEFIVFRRLEAEGTHADSAMGMLSMGKFLLEKEAPDTAVYFLKRAELVALKNEQYDLLDSIYHFQVAHIDQLTLNLDDVIRDWQNNTSRHQSRQKLDMAYAIIRKQLSDARLKGTTLDPEKIITGVFSDFSITLQEANDASFMFKIVQMTRSAIVSTKDYHRLEPFIVRVYSGLKKVGAFAKKVGELELGFLYMISHVYYRNRKFTEATNSLEEMLTLFPLRFFRSSSYYAKYIALCAAVASYSGKNAEAISIMNAALTDKNLRVSTTEKLNMQLNLAVYHFQSGAFRKSQRAMQDIGHHDSWLENKMGKEWRFKKNMIELIIQCELGHDEIALKQISLVEKHFGAFLLHPVYQRAKMFLALIKKIINKPDIVTSEVFAEEVKVASLGWPGDKEDIQAITFFCWLKSKMMLRNYYEVLLEAMERR